MLSLTVLTLLVAGAWSQQAGMMTTMMSMMTGQMQTTMPPPEPCCIPAVWQATVIDLKSQYDTVSTVVYDANKMQQGSWTFMRGSDQIVAHTLIDYSQRMMYNAEFLPGQAPMCKKEIFDMPMYSCMNSTKISNVTYLGSSTLGLRGMGIDYDGYSFKAGKYDFRIAMGSIPGMKNMCYPVLEDIKQPGVMEALYMFLDLTTTVEYPTILAMPAPCVGNDAAVIG